CNHNTYPLLQYRSPDFSRYFCCNDPPPTDIYTLSLHDALPISSLLHRIGDRPAATVMAQAARVTFDRLGATAQIAKLDALEATRSEEHTSELQSLAYLVCRLLLEKKKNNSMQLSYCLTHTVCG